MGRKYFSSESVTEGHPDKICDQISDAILDEILKQDKNARVACETVVSTGAIMLVGEISTTASYDAPQIARDVIRDIGYTDSELGFDYKSCAVFSALAKQSPDISMGVTASQEAREGSASVEDTVGAGDQGMMFGFACDETPELMPMPIVLAHKLAKKLAEVRKDGTLGYLRPDGKTQVVVEYRDDVPFRIDSVLVSAQHDAGVDMQTLKQGIKERVIEAIVPQNLLDSDTKIYVNPTGRFVIGGPHGDSGLTGRKIIVDTYGGFARHGGGAFSGKDPTKVDRSAAYAARYIAKNIVAAGLAKKCELQISYAIGIAKPMSVHIELFGTGRAPLEKIEQAVAALFDLRPYSIIKNLGLRNPIYRQLAAYGHMGRDDLDLPWEKTDKAGELRKLVLGEQA